MSDEILDRKRSSGISRKRRRIGQQLKAYRANRPKKADKRNSYVAIPSFFTLMNLLCGFGAITQIYEGRFDSAAWLILLAAFFDALDGMMARLTNSTSLFGVELDSLSDIVSFGVAPAFLVYVFGLNEFDLFGLIVSALPALCGAVRLARFNVSVEKSGDKPEYFCGLPIPVQAAAIVTLILSIENVEWFSRFGISAESWLIPVVAVLAGLMVSNIPFDALPKPSAVYLKKHPYKVGALLLGVILTITFQHLGLLVSITIYLVYGIIHGVVSTYREVMRA